MVFFASQLEIKIDSTNTKLTPVIDRFLILPPLGARPIRYPIYSFWPAPRCCATESLLTGLVRRRLFVKSGKEQFRRCRRVDRTIDDDVFGADSLPVQPTVTIAIRAKRRAFQRDPGKQSARTRIRKNLSPKCDVRRGCSVTALGPGGSSRVGAELDLASKNGIGPTPIHHQQNEVGGLAANLKPNAAALKSHHRRCAPTPVEIRPAPPRQHASAVTAADDEG